MTNMKWQKLQAGKYYCGATFLITKRKHAEIAPWKLEHFPGGRIVGVTPSTTYHRTMTDARAKAQKLVK